MDIVIGSGPAAASCAKGLLDCGREVLMVDVGEQLEPSRLAALHSLRSYAVEDWGQHSAAIKENTNANAGGVPKKLLAGSDFPFRWVDTEGEVIQQNVETLTSHALGGLSNIWGANLMPFLAQDVGDWDLPLSALEPYYQQVASYVPLAAQQDELADIFPIYSEHFSTLPFSKQADKFLNRLRARKEKLHGKGVYFGGSRLAVRANAGKEDRGCVLCGLCLYGCPYNLIYCSAWTVREMQVNPQFHYRSGVLAEKVESKNGAATVRVRHISDGTRELLKADRVFVGAGVVNSTRLLLSSLESFDEEVEIKDSQYFLLPLLSASPSWGVTSERLYALSQVCLGFLKNERTDRSVHGLIYTYNDLYLRAVNNMAGHLATLAKPLIHYLMGHLNIYQGYLHSDDSHGMLTRLEKWNGKERVVIRKRENPRTAEVLSEVQSKLLGLAPSLGAVPLVLMTQHAPTGKSYHIGGSFPMSNSPQKFGSTLNGQVVGLDHVYIVDASSFPSVPATNHTYTSMANAYRIGFES